MTCECYLQSWKNLTRGVGTKEWKLETTDSESRRTSRVSQLLQGSSKIERDKENRSKIPYLRSEDGEQGDGRRESVIEKFECLPYHGQWRTFEEGKWVIRNYKERIQKETGREPASNVPWFGLWSRKNTELGKNIDPSSFYIRPRLS